MDERSESPERSAWRFGDWRFRGKLLAASLLPVVAVTAILLALFLLSLQRVWRNSVPHKVELLRLEALSREYQAEIREYDLLRLEETRQEIEEIEEEIPEVLARLAAGEARDAHRSSTELGPLVAALLAEGDRLVASHGTAASTAATAESATGEAFAAFEEREEELETRIADLLAEAEGELADALERFGWMLAGSSVLGVGFGLFLALGLARHVQGPLQVLRQASERILDGDFRARDRIHTRDELGDLAEGFDRGAETIRRLLAEARDSLDDLKKHQAQLLQSGKMAAVGELAAGVAHELNNPLSAVLTYGVLVREKIERDPEAIDTEQLRERLELIEAAARRCKDIADKLLTFSRQDEGGALEPVSLAEVVDDAMALTHSLSKRRGVTLEIDADPDAPPVMGSSGQLQQVVVNLVSNAVQAMADGGQLKITTGRAGESGELVVSDDGPGIDPAVRDRIFEPFVTTKPAGQGTGLGLSIVYGIVEGHGGTVEVESEVGVGTSFTIRIPQVPTDPPVDGGPRGL